MKKLLFLIAIIAGLPVSLFAQKKANSYIGLSAGFAIPSAEYAKKDVNNPESGFGWLGIFAEFQTAVFFSKNFGIGLSATAAHHGFDDSAFVKSFSTKLPENYTITRQFDTPTQWSTILIGPEFSIPAGQFHFDFKLQAGYASMTPSTWGFEYTDALGNEVRVGHSESRTNVMGYQGGIAIRILKPVGLFISYDYMVVTGDVVATRTYGTGSSSQDYQKKLQEQFSYRKTITNSMIGVGLVYQFKRKD